MIYTEKTKRAIKLCFKAHEGQFDKGGLPYAHHPLHLAEQMDDEDSTIVALLHDVVEDILAFLVALWDEYYMTYVVVPGIVIGLAIILYGQFKYNRGIF